VQDDCITIKLGLPGVRVMRVEEEEQQITVEVQYRALSASCPRCGQRCPKVHSVSRQNKRDQGLWNKVVYLVLHKRRFRCLGCRKVFSEPDPVFGSRRRSSQRFRQHLGGTAMHQTIRHTAHTEMVGEGLVRRCLTEEAGRLLGAVAPHSSRVLGVDEFSIKKGHIYDTAIMDIEHKQVLGVVSGRGQKSVEEFLDRLPGREAIEAVVMDMHEPFRQAVELCLPGAKVVADKFHVITHVNQVLDQVRIGLQAKGDKKKQLFRRRYLLLKGAERLTEEDNERLARLFSYYPELAVAWALKERFRRWYRLDTREEAEAELAQWEESVRQHGPASFQKLFSMLRDWREEILNYFDHRYTNGFVEGKNNRIKVIKRLAYGYRNRENFRQRIMLTNVTDNHPKVA
jgi:transposase